MKRTDFYIAGLVVFQIFLFLHVSFLINAGAGISMMTQGGFDGYLSIALFVGVYVIIFSNLARLVIAIPSAGNSGTEEQTTKEIFRTARLSVVALIVFTALEFIQAFILLNTY